MAYNYGGSSIMAYDHQAIYKSQRRLGVGSTSGYPLIELQLDQLYHDMTDGKLGAGATTGSWYVGITSVKTAFPKP